MPKHSYNKEMTILENEEINIPFKGTKDNIILLDNINHENMTHLLKIKITDEKNNLGNIALPKLKKGEYDLYINNIKISIEVIKGNKMPINNYIITEDEKNIFYINNSEPPISIENVSYKNKELKIKLNKSGKNSNHPRIHINCVQYLPKKLNKNILNFEESDYFEKIHNELFYQLENNKNVYLNNKILSDEL